MAESKSQKVQDLSTRLAKKRGNGILRREVWVDSKGKVVRYNLAYNPTVEGTPRDDAARRPSLPRYAAAEMRSSATLRLEGSHYV